MIIRLWSWRWKPCQYQEGAFIWGSQTCNVLTHQRLYFTRSRSRYVDCGRHFSVRWLEREY